jgi:DNA-binding NtrC family response regulator
MASRSHRTDKKPPVERLRVLLIDDEADSLCPILAQDLRPLGFDLAKESDAAKALATIRQTGPQIALLDLRFPGDDRRADRRTTGGELLSKIRREFQALPVVVFTTSLDDFDSPLETFDDQPHGYFAKPTFARDETWPERLASALRSAADTARFAATLQEDDLGFLVGQTKEMHEAASRIRTAAQNSLPVLIYGEPGSGKRLAAEAIHKLSGRRGRFESFNCSGANVEQLESALLGEGVSRRTAGAKTGLFRLADNGTLFLDRFHELPLTLQDRLATFIEGGVFHRAGKTSKNKANVRLIVATNHNLSDLVADGVLREELAHRLGVALISLPPLRRRMADLPALFDLFIAGANEATGNDVQPVLRPETRDKLAAHSWPGNIRELESTLLRAVAKTKSNVLFPEDIEFLPIAVSRPEDNASSAPPSGELQPTPLSSVIDGLTDHLEQLPLEDRYDFLLGQGDQRKDIVEEFICRLRQKTGQRVRGKDLEKELIPIALGERGSTKLRQLLHACGVKLTQLDCNK